MQNVTHTEIDSEALIFSTLHWNFMNWNVYSQLSFSFRFKWEFLAEDSDKNEKYFQVEMSALSFPLKLTRR